MISPDLTKLDYYRDGERELFDLAVDPDETENLAADTADEHVGTIEHLAGEIFDWQVRTRDPIYLP